MTGSARRSRRRPSAWRRLFWFVVFIALAFYGGGGWYFANEIDSGALAIDNSPDRLRFDVEITDVGDGTVTYRLAGTSNPHRTDPGTYGMAWPDGFGIVGDIVDERADRVERMFEPVDGTLTPGTRTDLIGSVWPSDPQMAHGLVFDEVTYTSDLGEFGAWHVPGAGDDWALFVHGQTTPRYEALRLLPVVHAAGYHSLVIDYRNDPGAPEDPSGRYRYGITERADLEAAIAYAVDREADRILLVGYSLGGAIVANTLLESPSAERVEGVILDAPMLDLEAAIDSAAAARTLPVIGAVPTSLVSVAKQLASLRFGVDFAAIDYVARADEFTVPMLVFHGARDDRVPVAVSESLAEARPDLVTLEVFDRAEHISSWNHDPPRYEQAVAEFLAGLGG